MTRGGRLGCAAAAAGALIVVVAVASTTSLDAAISDRIFGAGGSAWPASHSRGWLRWSLYEGPKYLLAIGWLGLLVAVAWPRALPRLRLSRAEAIYLLVCLASVPLVITAIKYHSGVACAAELARYGGPLPDAVGHFTLPKLLDPVAQRGCWPSGHASGGFALLALGSLDRPAYVRWQLWAVGLVLGGAMGAYQIARGAHFVSHVLVTALVAQMLVCVLAAAMHPWLVRARHAMPVAS